MLFNKKYSFQLDQNITTLTQTLKKVKSIEQDVIGGEESYSVEFSWDEFVVTRKAMFERFAGIEPDAHIRLVPLSENTTQIDVTVKFSEIVWMILLIIQLGIIAVCLFGTEFNWWYRILLMIGVSGVWNFIIWLIFIQGSNTLKKVVKELFENTACKT